MANQNSDRFLSGLVEGYYGRTWAHDTRLQMLSFLSSLGLNTYLYCPKSDPFLRRQWQQDWPAPAWLQLRQLAERAQQLNLEFGVGLSPFALYQNYDLVAREQLRLKINKINELDASIVAVLFDDMPGDCPDLAQRQAQIVDDITHWSNARRVLVCPTYYSFDPVLEQHFGTRPADYWPALGSALARAVEVMWTGNIVCAETISVADVEAISSQLGRPVMLWDNYPVNDGAKRSNHLYCYAPPAREAGLRSVLSGHLLNPMNQALLSLPALLGLSELYGSRAELGIAELVGEPVWQQLQLDRQTFRDAGLSGLPDDLRQALASKYSAMQLPAAEEVAGWLRGEYTFDPACLTD